jgi:hypothetical protein
MAPDHLSPWLVDWFKFDGEDWGLGGRPPINRWSRAGMLGGNGESPGSLRHFPCPAPAAPI